MKITVRRRAAPAITTGFTKARLNHLNHALADTNVLISVVVPTRNPTHLTACIESVYGQCYQHWELCVVDDASEDPVILSDPRIKFKRLASQVGVGAATAAGVEMATGQFVAFLDHDDVLEPDALAEVALVIKTHPDADLIYTDEDKIIKESFADPYFKADWSPELLLSYNYINHLAVVRKSLCLVRSDVDGVQDWDLYLKIAEHTNNIYHVPRVLYHWRQHAGNLSAREKMTHTERGREVLKDALNRRGIRAEPVLPSWAKGQNIAFNLRFPPEGPSVCIIIPTRNQHDLLRACLRSLDKTTYRNYSIIIADNDSNDPDTLSYLKTLSNVVVIPNPGAGFSFSHVCNKAASMTAADYVLFLNDDTEVIDQNWLGDMVGYAQIPGVGAVGAKLVYPDFRVQHAGVVHGVEDVLPNHAFRNTNMGDSGYFLLPWMARNCCAVTGACLLTRRKLFLESGGFSADFPVAYNDIDYCYRVGEAGHRSVYCPTALLLHHESASRRHVFKPEELDEYKRRYRNYTDRYYNPNLVGGNLGGDITTYKPKTRSVAYPDMRPVRTAVLTHNLDIGGAQLIMKDVVTGTAITPTVFSPVDGPLRDELPNVIVNETLFDPSDRAVDRYCELLKGYDLVYANTILTFQGVIAASKLGIPSVWNIHESEPTVELLSSGHAITRTLVQSLSLPYRVIFGSDWTRAAYEPYNKKNNYMSIQNAVAAGHNVPDARHKLNIHKDEVAILSVGAVCDRKGQIDIVDALGMFDFNILHKVKCFVVGQGQTAYVAKLMRLMDARPQLKKRLILVPETRDVDLYYSAADIFVMASRIECFPRVIMEALTHGLPVVSTDVYGIKDQVRDGYNGYLVAARDYKSLSRRMAELCSDSKTRREMGNNSRRFLTTLPTIADNFKIYNQVFREASLTKAN